MKKNMICFILFFLPVILSAEMFEYEYWFKIDDKEKTVKTTMRREVKDGFIYIKSVSAWGTATAKCGLDGETLETYQKSKGMKGKETGYTAVKKDGKIYAKGKFMDKEFEKEIDTEGKPWFVFVEMQAADFIKSDKEYMEFRFLGGRDGLDGNTMSIKKLEKQKVEVMGKTEEAWKTEWRMTGFFSLFWSANHWFRASDGMFLKYECGMPESKGKLVKIIKN